MLDNSVFFHEGKKMFKERRGINEWKNNTQDKLIIACVDSGKDYMDKIDFLKNIRQRRLIYAYMIYTEVYVEVKGES